MKLTSDREYLVLENQRLVHFVIRKMNPKAWEYEDLVSIGTLGLIQAAIIYDELKCKNFLPLAIKCIKNEILKYYAKSRKNPTNTISLKSAVPGSESLILEEIIVQHPQMCFGNKSVNTLRVNSVLDNGGMVHIIKTSLRCGIGDSIVDNYSAGGVVYPVNSKYGRVEGPGANSTRGQEIFIHPGTEMFMIGLEIPFWSQVEELICNAARLIPQVRFVGWDVAITKDGPVLVEGNTRPGAQLIEYQGFDKGLYKKILSYR